MTWGTCRWPRWARSFCSKWYPTGPRDVTTNLPFSEWTTVFPNPRLCKALLDRFTDRAHIIETGTESYPLPTHDGEKEETVSERRIAGAAGTMPAEWGKL